MKKSGVDWETVVGVVVVALAVLGLYQGTQIIELAYEAAIDHVADRANERRGVIGWLAYDCKTGRPTAADGAPGACWYWRSR